MMFFDVKLSICNYDKNSIGDEEKCRSEQENIESRSDTSERFEENL